MMKLNNILNIMLIILFKIKFLFIILMINSHINTYIELEFGGGVKKKKMFSLIHFIICNTYHYSPCIKLH